MTPPCLGQWCAMAYLVSGPLQLWWDHTQQIAVVPHLILATVLCCASMLGVLLLVADVPILTVGFLLVIASLLGCWSRPSQAKAHCACELACPPPLPSTLMLHSAVLLIAPCADVRAIVLLLR